MIQITEIFPNPEGQDGTNEWIELTNTSTTPIPLAAYTLDDEENGSKPYTIPESAHLTLTPNNPTILKKSETGLNLNNDGDTVRLFNPEGTLIDSLTYGKTEEGLSFSKTTLISEQGKKEITAWTAPSPGAPPKPFYKFTGLITTPPEIAEDFYFTLQPENSEKSIKIIFEDPPLNFETASLTMPTNTKLTIITAKTTAAKTARPTTTKPSPKQTTSHTEFTLIDYKVEETATTNSATETSTTAHPITPNPASPPTSTNIIPIIVLLILIIPLSILAKLK